MQLNFRDTYANITFGLLFFGLGLLLTIVTLPPESFWLKPYFWAISIISLLIALTLLLGYPVSSLLKRLLGWEVYPGFGAYLVVILGDAKVVRKKYLFEFKTPEGSSASLYLSASDHCTLSVTDVRGDTYELQMQLESKTISLHKPIVLGAEVGVGPKMTVLRIFNGTKEIGRRDLPFEIDLGSRDWVKGGGVIGADAAHQNNGRFVLAALMVLNATISNAKRKKLIRHLSEKWGIQ